MAVRLPAIKNSDRQKTARYASPLRYENISKNDPYAIGSARANGVVRIGATAK